MHKIFVIIFLLSLVNYAQQEGDTRFGADPRNFQRPQGAFFDYSDPEAINIKVSVWGYVRYPGIYMVPEYSSVMDLVSFAGGPSDDADLEDIRIYRVKDQAQELIKFNYNDLLWEKEVKNISPKGDLVAGDVLILPGEPRLYFRDYMSITLSVVSTLISLSILILNIAKG